MGSSGANPLTHIAHSHPLELLQERIDQDSTCSGCNARLLTGPGTAAYYACQRCRFYLHNRCAHAPTSKKFSSVHSHHAIRLGFLASQNGTICGICNVRNGKTPIVGLFYNCKLCNFDAHLSCVAPWRDSSSSALYHFAHQHPLEPFHGETRGRPICAGCQSQLCTGSSTPHHFACLECSFYLDFRCAAAPLSMHFPFVHSQHALTLRFQAGPGTRGCDVCTQRNTTGPGNSDIVGLYYECRACEFDAHISCVEPWRGNGVHLSDEVSDDRPYINLATEFESLGIRINARGLHGGKPRNPGASSI